MSKETVSVTEDSDIQAKVIAETSLDKLCHDIRFYIVGILEMIDNGQTDISVIRNRVKDSLRALERMEIKIGQTYHSEENSKEQKPPIVRCDKCRGLHKTEEHEIYGD
jgi:inorganic pyrophosphatase